jgi:hypothetical protein
MEEIQAFDPVLFSDAENRFLLAHLGEPSIVALRAPMEQGCNRAALKPILERVNELQELKKHDGQEWIGIDAMKASINAWLRENAKWASDHRRSGRRAPRYPSLYSYDARKRPHRGGPGSDSDRVRTYFGPAGERIPFAVTLIPENVLEWQAPGFTEAPQKGSLIKVDGTVNRIECLVPIGDGICGHTESYKAESRQSYQIARARMSKHLRKATENVDGHREAHTNEFGE